MHSLRPGFMKFEGYWHEEAKNLPFETLFRPMRIYNAHGSNCGNDDYWIRIDSKKQHNLDTVGP